jgi:hypothetical protein
MECFFAIAPLPILQSHCDKIAITHMFVYATGFFSNRSTSAVCYHTVKDVCNHLYFHQVATTSSKDQSSRILTVSWRGPFLNWFIAIALFYQFFCNRNHIAIRVQSHCDNFCNQPHSGLQLSFFLQSQHISRCKHTAKDVAITSNLTRLQPHQAKTTLAAILQCHGMELFFELVFFTRVFYNCFFCKITALRLQSHCFKGASNHPHFDFCNCHVFAIAAHQLLQPHVKNVAISCIFTRLQPHQANTNLVAI